MRKNLVFLLIIVLVIALATCFMTVGCAQEESEGTSVPAASSSQGTGRISTSKDGGGQTSSATSVVTTSTGGGQSASMSVSASEER